MQNSPQTEEKSSTDMFASLSSQEYKYGFSTDIETDSFPKGLSEEVIRKISAIKEEPEFMLEFRLKSYEAFKNMVDPDWAKLNIPAIDYQDIIYYSAPKAKPTKESLDEVIQKF